MQIALTEREAVVLREALASYLPELRMEIARTEAKEYRHGLFDRERLFERLLAELDRNDG
ncbi:MAG TPA: hypothetical protein VFS44_12050 [Gemmatimonadaceae bacterium]|nr:hypothetical protein [Gemmatimonadaceae bacterium]